MSEKLEKTYTRTEMADRLEHLSQQIRSGKLELDEYSGTIPEALGLKLHLKEKKGEMRCKLELRWSTLAGYDEAERHEVQQWQTSFKQIKKELARSFKELKRAAQGEMRSDHASLQAFVASSRAFAAIAAPQWPEATQAYLSHVDNLLRAVDSRLQESILHELQDLENDMVSCHRELR